MGLVPGNYLEIIEALPDDEDEDSSEETVRLFILKKKNLKTF